MIQNRYRTGNDTNMPGRGFLIWHIDATPTTPGGRSFRYNNSFTERKLLRLLEADGLEQFEAGQPGDATDYYRSGHDFSTTSTPNSRRYDGSSTGIRVRHFSATALQMTADFTYGAPLLALSTTNLILAPPASGSDRTALVISNAGSEVLEARFESPGNDTVRDSRSGEPAFAWHDIATTGTAVPQTDDGVVGPLPIGFSFPFYGAQRTQFYISMNSVITFDTSNVPYDNTALPSAAIAGGFLAPWWDDLNPSASGAVRYLSHNGRLTISWLDVPTYGENTRLKTFQAIISSNGVIAFQYHTMTGSMTTATIGIQGGTNAHRAVQVAYNSNTVGNGVALTFTPPALPDWLTIAPMQVTVQPGAAALCAVSASAAGKTNGVYHTVLHLNHNDPDCAVPVPITINMAVPEPAAALLVMLACAVRCRTAVRDNHADAHIHVASPPRAS